MKTGSALVSLLRSSFSSNRQFYKHGAPTALSSYFNRLPGRCWQRSGTTRSGAAAANQLSSPTCHSHPRA